MISVAVELTEVILAVFVKLIAGDKIGAIVAVACADVVVPDFAVALFTTTPAATSVAVSV